MYKITFLILIFLSSLFSAQEAVKYPVEVSHSGDDIVGGRLAYAVKEKIRNSSSLQMSYSEDARLTVILVTLDQTPDRPGASSCYSFVLCMTNPNNYFPNYITSSVGYCGSSRVTEVADGIVADIDKVVDNIRRAVNNYDNNSYNR